MFRRWIEKEVPMREARFIYILDLMLYHLLLTGNNFSIDKLEDNINVPSKGNMQP